MLMSHKASLQYRYRLIPEVLPRKWPSLAFLLPLMIRHRIKVPLVPSYIIPTFLCISCAECSACPLDSPPCRWCLANSRRPSDIHIHMIARPVFDTNSTSPNLPSPGLHLQYSQRATNVVSSLFLHLSADSTILFNSKGSQRLHSGGATEAEGS